MILHITSRDAWDEALAKGSYRGDTLDREGFIHCCLPRQLDHVLTSYFAGRDDLVMLRINGEQVAAEIRWEGAADQFPHIHGALNLDAVEEAKPIP